MDGFSFSTELNVRFSETDAQGIANNATYLAWFEVARVSYLRQFPGGYRGLIEKGVEALTLETYVPLPLPASSTTSCASTYAPRSARSALRVSTSSSA